MEQVFGVAGVVEREAGRRGVAALFFHLGEVQCAAKKAWWGAGFEAAKLDAGFEEAGGKGFGAEITKAAAFVLVLADVHEAAQEGAGGDDHGQAVKLDVEVGANAGDFLAGEDESGDGGLEDLEVGLELQGVLEAELVSLFIALGAGRLDSGAFGFVEQAELNGGDVGVEAHFATESVDFADHLALGLAADGGVAAHLGNGVDIAGEEQGGGSHAGGGKRGFAAGVAGAADDDVEGGLVVEHEWRIRIFLTANGR